MEFTTSFELQSQATRLRYTAYNGGLRVTNGIVTLSDTLFQEIYTRNPQRHACYNTRRFDTWALPASVALTEGILVSFFSSA